MINSLSDGNYKQTIHKVNVGSNDELELFEDNIRALADSINVRFPLVDFAIWDLSSFYNAFHNVRRNIVFIECDKVIHEELVHLIVADENWRTCAIYMGERKPKIINELVIPPVSKEQIESGRFDLSSPGTIVIVHRTDFDDTTPYTNKPSAGGRYFMPVLERKLVDLLAYALRGWVPVQISEAVDAMKWSFRNKNININVLQKYAARRYLGWFVAILLYKLKANNEIEYIDPRYVENGAKYIDALNELNEL